MIILINDPVQKIKSPFFLFQNNQSVKIKNAQILTSFNRYLGATVSSHTNIPVSYGSELRDTYHITKELQYHKYHDTIMDMIKNVSTFPLVPIN